MKSDKDPLQQFLDLSAVLTGFNRLDLLGTGMARSYYDELTGIVGETLCSQLWSVWSSLRKRIGGDALELEKEVGRKILKDSPLGPMARNIIKMWYTGNWAQLPQAWRNQHGAGARDVDHVISSQAYQEGLLWRAIGAHPQGAKQPGFGTWALPPRLNDAS